MAFLAWFILLACVRDPTPSDKHAAATVAGLPASRFPIFPFSPLFRFPAFPSLDGHPFSTSLCVSGMRLSFQLMAFNGFAAAFAFLGFLVKMLNKYQN